MNSSPLNLKFAVKRRKTKFVLSMCVICQQNTSESLRKASSLGKSSFLKVLNIRHTAGQCAQYEGLESILNINDSDKLAFKEPEIELVWHKNCFSSFTSTTNLAAVQGTHVDNDVSAPSDATRKQRCGFNFKACCMLCPKKTRKKYKNLIRVATYNFCSTLEKRVDEKHDDEMKPGVDDFSKLIAQEARYHKACHSRYIMHSKPAEHADSPYSLALQDLIEDILPDLQSGLALDMNCVLAKYQDLLKQ